MRVGLVAVVALCVACGYGFVQYDASLGDVRTVAIDTPRNESTEPGIEFLVADSLRREFLRRGAVQLVDDPSSADLVLSGRIASLRESGQAFSSVVLTIEYRLTLALDLRAARSDGSEVPLDSRAQRETESYLSSADLEAQRKNRQEALRHLAALLAGRVYDSLYETLTP